MKILITDPGYLVPGDDWSDLLSETDFFRGEFPVKVNRSLIIHKAEGTPSGDCGFGDEGRQVCCDSGMFCVAEVSDRLAEQQNTPHGKFGKFYPTLPEALADFDRVVKWADAGGDPTEMDTDGW